MDKFDIACESYRKGDYFKALIEFKESLLTNDDLGKCLYNIGVCYIKLKNFEKAIEYLLEATKAENNYQYFYNLGYVYARLLDFKKSYVSVKMASALKPDDVGVQELIKFLENKIIFKKKEEK
ncbi:MAG TPA: tetratricopeptide repeat protein [Pseudoneobacillus sp.]|nr:tetratricopeptide repeat protein [Pseudoneobacillus sp.]